MVSLKQGDIVSNIPFNTVASVLMTTTVQTQSATAIDRKNQEALRSQKAQTVQTQRHAEEVEDPGDYGLDSIQEEHRGQTGQQQEQKGKRQAAAQVEIEGVTSDEADSQKAEGAGGLDISA